MAVINLETAVFWGQLSHCKHLRTAYHGYSCDDTDAYGAVSAFASLLFMLHSFVAGWLTKVRAEFIDETGAYDEINAAEGKGDYV